MPVKPTPTIVIFASSCTPTPEGYTGYIEVLNVSIRIKFKNVITSLGESDIEVLLDPLNSIPTKALRFHLKAFSDSNKEALSRQLKLAFNDFVFPWTLIVNEIAVIFLEALNNHKQIFKLSEIEGEPKGWLFEPFVEEHSINLFFGMGSGGKTLTSLFVGLMYSQGLALFNKEKAKKGKVLLIDFENDGAEWRDTIKGLAYKYNVDLEVLDECFKYWHTEQIPLYNQVEKLKTCIRENNISLIIVDSVSMASGDSTSDEASALRLMAAVKLLNTTTILIAHQRKNEGEDTPIGSIQYFNQARNIWHIEGIPDETDERILHIGGQHKKHNSGRKWKNPIGFKVFFGDGYIDMHLEDAKINFKEKFTLKAQILDSLQSGGKTHIALGEELDKKPGHIAKELNYLKKKGKVENFTGVWTLIPE